MLKCPQLLLIDPKNMLEFWFNPKVSIFHKLLIFVVIAIATGGLYWMEPLKPDAILMFMGTGIIFLICRYCKIHFAAKNPTGLFYRLLVWIPLALLLVWRQPSGRRIELATLALWAALAVLFFWGMISGRLYL